jgi:putative nucleotidyltransferase with HDIG domain
LATLLLPPIANQLPEQLHVVVINADGEQILTLDANPAQPGSCDCREVSGRVAYDHLDDVLNGRADRYGIRYVGLAPDGGQMLLYTVGPIVDENGYLAGALVVGERLGSVLAAIQQRAHVQTALFTTAGVPLGSTSDFAFPIPELAASDRIAATTEGGVSRRVEAAGHQAQIFYVPWVMRFEPRGYAAIVVPVDPIVGAQALLILVILAISLAALALTLIVGSVVTRAITRPLDALLQATSAVAGGDLGYRARVDSADEIGRLTASFNDMTTVLAERTGRLERLSDDTLRALAAAIDARDNYTHGHSIRVAAYSNALARAAGLDAFEIDALGRGCLVHDIGKIGVPDRILRKPGPLAEDERDEMRRHPVIGQQMLRGLEWDREVFDVVLHHHERWDGLGYPLGLGGERIPRVARVVAIADTLDAMTSSRPYRPAFSFKQACALIVGEAGTQFDPDLVRAFIGALDEIKRRADALGAGRRPERTAYKTRRGGAAVANLRAVS